MKKKREKKKGFSILEEYRKSWKYVKDSRKFIYFSAGIFLLFLLIGFFVPTPEFLYDKIMSFIRELLAQTQNMSELELSWFIVSNNVVSTFISLISGVVLGIYPIFNSIANGYMLGFVSSISVENSGITSLWKVLPHGIFELPAVFISLGLGIKTGMFIFKKKKMEYFKDYFINSFKVFLLIVIPLLIIAGIIEATLMLLLK